MRRADWVSHPLTIIGVLVVGGGALGLFALGVQKRSARGQAQARVKSFSDDLQAGRTAALAQHFARPADYDSLLGWLREIQVDPAALPTLRPLETHTDEGFLGVRSHQVTMRLDAGAARYHLTLILEPGPGGWQVHTTRRRQLTPGEIID